MKLKELAAELGLSQTTVSRALNNFPEVAAATRKRVQDAAAAHDYHPNARAKGLATGRTLSIGHVIPISTGHQMVNPIFSDFIAGASEIYAQNGYEMHLSVVPATQEERVYRELASRRSVDGVIVHGPVLDDPRIALLKEVGLPFVVHGRAGQGDDQYSWVDVNNTRAMQKATEFLIERGHSRIALVNGLDSMDFARRRRLGYEKAHAAHGLVPDPELMRSEDMTEGYGFRTAREILALPTPPTAFVVSSMITAIGVRRAIGTAGLRIGRDVCVAIYDDELSYLHNGEDAPIFTAAQSSVHLAGKYCAEMLLDIIRDPSQPPRQKLLEAEFVVGDSTGPAPVRENQNETEAR